MGSYDTGEYNYTPRRSISEGRRSTPRQTTRRQGGTENAPAYNRPAPQAQYDPNLPTIAAVGGGLTPARIVKQLPDEMKEKSLNDIINHLMSAEVVSTKEESAIVEAIKDRQSKSDYRAVVNNFYNFHNSKLPAEMSTGFYQKKERRTNGEAKSINFLDIAIISHDEGGRAHEYNLEKICD